MPVPHRLANPYATDATDLPPADRRRPPGRGLRAALVGVTAAGGVLGAASPAFAWVERGSETRHDEPGDPTQASWAGDEGSGQDDASSPPIPPPPDFVQEYSHPEYGTVCTNSVPGTCYTFRVQEETVGDEDGDGVLDPDFITRPAHPRPVALWPETGWADEPAHDPAPAWSHG